MRFLRALWEWLMARIRLGRIKFSPPPSPTPISAITVTPTSPSVDETILAGSLVFTLGNNLGVSCTYTLDNSDFTFASDGSAQSSTTGVTAAVYRASTGTLTGGVDETINVTADDGVVASPIADVVSVNVVSEGDDVLLSIVSTKEIVASGAKTNEIVTFGFPMAASALAGGRSIKIVDDDGSGGAGSTLANFQIDYTSSDFDDNVRWCRPCGIVPALASGGNRKLRVYSSADAPPTGTAITASDLLATSFETVITFVMKDGTTAIWDARDALAASVPFDKTDYGFEVLASGPMRTTWKLRGPPMVSGSALGSGDSLHVVVYLSAFKASTGAVSGGNPITAVKAIIKIENGAVDRSSPAHHFYSLTIQRSTSLSDGTLITTDQTDPLYGIQRFVYGTSQPSTTLTLAGAAMSWSQQGGTLAYVSSTQFTNTQNASTGNYKVGNAIRNIQSNGTSYGIVTASTWNGTLNTVTVNWLSGGLLNETMNIRYSGYLYWDRASGVWDADIVGKHIHSTDHFLNVDARISDTRIATYFYAAGSSSAPSYTSGNWTIYGVGHAYNSRGYRTLWIGNRPTNVIAYGEHADASNPDVSHATYFQSTGLDLDYQIPQASITHTMTNLNNYQASDGTVPFLRSRPGLCGDITMAIGASGGRPDIGRTSGFNVYGMRKYNADGKRKIFQNAEHWLTYRWLIADRYDGSPSAGALGCPPSKAAGVNYKYSAAFNGTLINEPSSPSNWWAWTNNTAHEPCMLYYPWILTGDEHFLDGLQRQTAFSNGIAFNTGYHGSGAVKTCYGASDGSARIWGSTEARARAWGNRTCIDTFIATPDDISGTAFMSKAYCKSDLEHTFLAAANFGPRDTKNAYTGAGSLVEVHMSSGNHDVPLWQMAYNILTLEMARTAGALNDDGLEFYDWLDGYILSRHADTGVVFDILKAVYIMRFNGPMGTVFNMDNPSLTPIFGSWAELYKANMTARLPYKQGEQKFSRIPTGTVTLSDASVGTGRTLTTSEDYFGAGSWYVDAYISASSEANGYAQITAVNGPREVVVTIITAFTSTTPTPSTIRLPGPHPDDYTGQWEAFTTAGYGQLEAASARCIRDKLSAQSASLTVIDDFLNKIVGTSNFTEAEAWQWIASRSGGA